MIDRADGQGGTFASKIKSDLASVEIAHQRPVLANLKKQPPVRRVDNLRVGMNVVDPVNLAQQLATRAVPEEYSAVLLPTGDCQTVRRERDGIDEACPFCQDRNASAGLDVPEAGAAQIANSVFPDSVLEMYGNKLPPIRRKKKVGRWIGVVGRRQRRARPLQRREPHAPADGNAHQK